MSINCCIWRPLSKNFFQKFEVKSGKNPSEILPENWRLFFARVDEAIKNNDARFSYTMRVTHFAQGKETFLQAKMHSQDTYSLSLIHI